MLLLTMRRKSYQCGSMMGRADDEFGIWDSRKKLSNTKTNAERILSEFANTLHLFVHRVTGHPTSTGDAQVQHYQ